MGAKTIIKNNGKRWMEENENSLAETRVWSHCSIPTDSSPTGFQADFVYQTLASGFLSPPSLPQGWWACRCTSPPALWAAQTHMFLNGRMMMQTQTDSPLACTPSPSHPDYSWNPHPVSTRCLSCEFKGRGRTWASVTVLSVRLWTSKLVLTSTPRRRERA